MRYQNPTGQTVVHDSNRIREILGNQPKRIPLLFGATMVLQREHFGKMICKQGGRSCRTLNDALMQILRGPSE